MTASNAISIGIYSVSEAAKLTKVSPSRIRRWLRGYDFRKGTLVRHSNEVWKPQIEFSQDGKLALGFLDLIEIRFVNSFIEAGVSWKTMRDAHVAAAHEFDTQHPFCTNRFATDGHRILLRQAHESGDQALLDIVTGQQEFSRIVGPFLKELEFDDAQVLARWWPMGRGKSVVLDPERNFGQPTAPASGVPTTILAKSFRANPSLETVSRWFEVTTDEVRDAVEFETQLAA